MIFCARATRGLQRRSSIVKRETSESETRYASQGPFHETGKGVRSQYRHPHIRVTQHAGHQTSGQCSRRSVHSCTAARDRQFRKWLLTPVFLSRVTRCVIRDPRFGIRNISYLISHIPYLASRISHPLPPSRLSRSSRSSRIARAERSQPYQANCACKRPTFSQAPGVP